ncbi:hypothetical protein BHE74_00028687, partial [Ensete ventricosum]
SQQKTIINSMAVNEDGVLATADNCPAWFVNPVLSPVYPCLSFWLCLQQSVDLPKFLFVILYYFSGSLESEACIYALSYDISGSRIVTCEADKTIKMWKEDPSATPDTHPLNFKPPKEFRRY